MHSVLVTGTHLVVTACVVSDVRFGLPPHAHVVGRLAFSRTDMRLTELQI